MAIRQVYKVSNSNKEYVEKFDVNFIWNPGFAVTQKQKNIKALQSEYKKIYSKDKVLEISTKSDKLLGINLSAFNLKMIENNKTFSVECAFQSSKKFENSGPHLDILNMDSRSAKRDERLKTSGQLLGFEFSNKKWPLEPKTLFYDWLYMTALYNQKDLAKEILNYNAFTDIEFNSQKSINCQAYSAALFVSLSKRNLINEAMYSIDNYKKIILNLNSKCNSNFQQITFF